MPKRLFTPLLLLFLILSGCASLGQYSIDESQLESYLRQAVTEFDRQQMQSGSPISVALKEVDISVGPDGRDVVVLEVTSEFALNALLTKLPVEVGLKVEGAPIYNSTEKAVYIRRLKLLDSRIDSPFLTDNFTPVTQDVMKVLGQMLEVMPVYRLNENNLTESLLAQIPLDIKVGPGKLMFVPAE